MVYPINTIVAGIAAVDETDPVLASALEIAARTGARLHLVHAFHLPDLVWDAYAQMGMIEVSALDDHIGGLRTRLEAQVRAESPDDRHQVEIIAGPPAAMILAAAVREEPDLILVGTTRRGAFARAILGTTAQRGLRHAPVPVLVLRGPLPRHLLRVLLTTDLSEFSGRIHESGLDVVETLFGDEKPEIRSLHVVWHGGDLPYPVQHELPDEGGSLTSFLGQRRIRTRSVQPTIRYGDPAKEIAAEVSDWGADLLVMGTHGRKGAVRWFLGSVAELTIRSAVSSVLVIPALAEEQRMLQTAPAATAPDG